MASRTALTLAAVAFLVACKPPPAVTHREAADELLRQSDFAGAAAEYVQSLAADPRQEKLWEKLAYCRAKTGEKRLAAEALVKVAELRPEDARKAEAYRNAAGIFLQGTDRAERAEAERYLVEAVRLEPRDDASLTWLGALAAERGGAQPEGGTVVPAELDKAIGWYAKLIALRPEANAPYLNRRVVLVRYLSYLADERRLEAKRLRKGGAEAADAAERIARLDAKAAELQRLLDETNQRLAPRRKATAT
jgi:hypothetical protein